MVEGNVETVELGKQLVVSAGMMLAVAIVHAMGLVATSRALHLRAERLKEMDFSFHSLALMAGMMLMLLLLHSIEILMFAGFYLAVGAMTALDQALYYSAAAYATLGRTADYFPETWRMIGAVEALIGFLMIGWSTAFMTSKADRLMPN